jgi:aryl-alcohol dehydrogenase-like predicted oxidoreductase
MKYLEVKSAGKHFNISKLSLGTAKYGNSVNQKDAYSFLNIFTEAGGNCIDTARSYSGGKSEEIIGQWIKTHNNRSSIILSTKGGDMAPDGRRRLSAEDIKSDFEKSLEALQTGYIDLYWIHKDDIDRHVEEIIDTINAVFIKGSIGILGCSNWHVERIARANEYAEKNGLQGFSISQIEWNLARTDEILFKKHGAVVMSEPEYKWYYEHNMPLFAFGSQARGFFSKVASMGLENIDEESRKNYGFPDNIQRFERVKKYAEKHNMPISRIALGYLIFNKLPNVAIIGSSNKDQLNDSLSAINLDMTEQEADYLFYGEETI